MEYKIQNYIYAGTILKVQSSSLSKVQSLSMSSQSLLILWGDFVVSHPEVMIGYVQSIVRLRVFVLSHFLAW